MSGSGKCARPAPASGCHGAPPERRYWGARGFRALVRGLRATEALEVLDLSCLAGVYYQGAFKCGRFI